MVEAIGDGSLPPETFRYYFTQNIRYLEAYARAIAYVTAKAPDRRSFMVLRSFLDRIVDDELPANERFLSRLSAALDADAEIPEPDGVETHLVTHGYTRHLLHVTATDTCAAGLTAILPCQWSYGELAKRLISSKPDEPIYAEWIDLFGDDSYDELVDQATGLLDHLTRDTSDRELDRLSAIFDMSTRYEIAFWDMAHGGGA